MITHTQPVPQTGVLPINISSVVVAIALYHYLRIFASWSDAFTYVDGTYVQDGAPFNEGYRYVDWLLTVPLLLAELVIVLKLAKNTTRSTPATPLRSARLLAAKRHDT